MDEVRKYAYRMLMYHAMLDLRVGGPSFAPAASPSSINAEELRHAKLVAYWLHNLALRSAKDFLGFDEKTFWAQHKHFAQHSPSPLRFESYSQLFNQLVNPGGNGAES